jgi:hypothetical protein
MRIRDSTFHPDADPYSWFFFDADADPDPNFQIKAKTQKSVQIGS